MSIDIFQIVLSISNPFLILHFHYQEEISEREEELDYKKASLRGPSIQLGFHMKPIPLFQALMGHVTLTSCEILRFPSSINR